MPGERSERWLWNAFGALFTLVAAATFAPVEPVVGVFPFWSLFVLLACFATVAVATVAVSTGWPAEVDEA